MLGQGVSLSCIVTVADSEVQSGVEADLLDYYYFIFIPTDPLCLGSGI